MFPSQKWILRAVRFRRWADGPDAITWFELGTDTAGPLPVVRYQQLLSRAPPACAPADRASVHSRVIARARGSPAPVRDDRQGVRASVTESILDRVAGGPEQAGLL
jgi:hypothetical protein